jgi:hypothetical protein
MTQATAPTTFVEESRPHRVAALMWVAEHAGILSDGYNVTVGATYDSKAGGLFGDVSVLGEPGALQALVARLDAVRNLDKDGDWREWVTFEDGVRIRLVEGA